MPLYPQDIDIIKKSLVYYFDTLVKFSAEEALPEIMKMDLLSEEPSSGKTGYFIGIKYCSKCNRFMYSEGIFCLCCKANLRTGPYDKNARAKRKA